MDEKDCPILCSKLGRPRSEAARQAVLCAANSLLIRDGFQNVTMEAIAAAAGVSKATLYRWWPHKSAVLMEAFLAEAAPCCAAQETGDIREDLRRRLRGLAAALGGGMGAVLAAILAEAQADPEAAEAFRTQYLAPRRAEALDALSRAQARGQIRPDAALETVVDALYGPLYFRLLAGYPPLTLDFADSLAETVLDGILPK